MFEFQEDVRKAYEAIPIPLVIDRFIDEKVVPILISDGFCGSTFRRNRSGPIPRGSFPSSWAIMSTF